MSAKRRRLDRTSQPDALDLAQCNLVLCPVVKFGCSRGLVSRHLLGVLQPSVIFQVNGDAGCSPGVTSHGVSREISKKTPQDNWQIHSCDDLIVSPLPYSRE